MDAYAGIARESLEDNYLYWLRKWSPRIDPAPAECFVRSMAATHTCPGEKWLSGESRFIFPYREILFDDGELLSERQRRASGRLRPGEDIRIMAHAREVGLDGFVFSYLGVHDPYYSTSYNPALGRSYTCKPYGFFFGPELDLEPGAIATRRDLNSPESEIPPDREFMSPDEARLFVHYQVLNTERHNKDFWHYWGAFQLWSTDASYRDNRWTWTIELHHRDSISVRNLEAILWPVEYMAVETLDSGKASISEDILEIERFRLQYPQVSIVPYLWDDEPSDLVRISEATARFVLDNGTYPTDEDMALSHI